MWQLGTLHSGGCTNSTSAEQLQRNSLWGLEPKSMGLQGCRACQGGGCSGKTFWESQPLNEVSYLGCWRGGDHTQAGVHGVVMGVRKARPWGMGHTPVPLAGGRDWYLHYGGDLHLLCSLLNSQDPGTKETLLKD